MWLLLILLHTRVVELQPLHCCERLHIQLTLPIHRPIRFDPMLLLLVVMGRVRVRHTSRQRTHVRCVLLLLLHVVGRAGIGHRLHMRLVWSKV